MKAEIVYMSSQSYKKSWQPINIKPVTAPPEGFIFSTSKRDKAPLVITRLNLPDRTDGLVIDIWNPLVNSCHESTLELKIFSSPDGQSWRENHFTSIKDFVDGKIPLKIALNDGERFLMFRVDNPRGNFQLGGINISADCAYANELEYDYRFYRFAKRFGDLTNSQQLQDIFALYNCGFRSNFFLEFGVADGVKLSNSLLLETLGWSGIVGEALDSYYRKAQASRTCTVVHGALASESGNEIEFYERGLLSSSVIYSASDMHAKAREQGSKVKCFTKRIDEILHENAAPKEIGYFSLDVEGAELEVLKTFPFGSYQVKCSTIEHNHTDQEGEIDKIMFDNGFKRVLREISGNDGFYVHQKASIFEWEKSGFVKIRKHKTVDDFMDFFEKKLQGWW